MKYLAHFIAHSVRRCSQRPLLLAGLASTMLFQVSCSDSDEKGSSADSDNVVYPDPCASSLSAECGISCESDTQCSDATHCSADGACSAECTAGASYCDGTCSKGRCSGTISPVVVRPGGGSGGELIVGEDGESSPGLGNGETCAGLSLDAEVKPVDMFIMFDRSSSMNQNNKWVDATTALIAFLEDSGTADLGIALRFFSDNNPADGCDNVGCSAEACSQPLVDVGTVTSAAGDAQEQALVNAINSTPVLTESQGTPIYSALGGALMWAESHQTANPERAAVVILVTDGEPNGCTNDIGSIAGLAADGYSAGIRTYAIGLEGSQEAQMDRIAMSGGTGSGIFIGGNGNAREELITALNEIRGQTLACDFATPTSENGMAVNSNQVNITLTKSDGTATPFLKTEEAECGTEQNWYYPGGDTSRIVLCPAACDLVTGDGAAQLEVQLGCATVQAPVIMK